MAQKNNQNFTLTHFKHNIVPSTFGGVTAYLLSGLVVLGLAVFASVWVGNMLSHHLHKK